MLDMNLMVALDALLTENSVTAAAARLHTSPPAMSRSLARLRRLLGDPLLVRAGRDMVPTRRALELRAEVHDVMQRARVLLEPSPASDPAHTVRVFDLRMSDIFSMTVTAQLITDVRAEAPGITLRLRPEGPDDTGMRDGLIDLDVGILGRHDPEVHSEPLFTETLVGVVRSEHPFARRAKVTVRQFAAADHVAVSRRGRRRGPIDDRLDELGLTRKVVAVVPTYAASLFLARATDVVCIAPARAGRDTVTALGLHAFELPLSLPTPTIEMAWHPRNDSDRTHQWLRDRIRRVITPRRP
ncbi:LysR family transcriptional regulator [Actinoplanes sp. NPDC004185]